MTRPAERSIAVIALALGMVACKDGQSGTTAQAEKVEAAAPLAYWARLSATDATLYPAPTPVSTVDRVAEIPRVVLARAGAKPVAAAANTAVELELLASGSQPRVFGFAAPEGSEFVVIDTRWRNIHSKQRMDKATQSGAVDRTMGVGGFAGGKQAGKASDSVDVDVAYQIPRFLDHVYLVSDGLATSLHAATKEIPGGAAIDKAFTIAKLGETRDARFAFLAPAKAKNVALQFFDYEYGNIVVPVRGNAKKAIGDGSPPSDVIDKAQSTVVDLATHSISYRADLDGTAAPDGWRYAVIRIGGRSKSSSQKMKNIVQIDPLRYMWLEGDGGYVYPSAGGSTTAGVLRFTPEIYQVQEVAFLVPAKSDRFRIGVRAENEVMHLAATDGKPSGIPRAKKTYADGKTMEVLLFGTRQEGDHIIADLGVRPLGTEGKGIEIQPDQQFILVTSGGEVQADMPATWSRVNRPPQPFVVPPGTPVRFELAFPMRGSATAIKVRGFEKEGTLDL